MPFPSSEVCGRAVVLRGKPCACCHLGAGLQFRTFYSLPHGRDRIHAWLWVKARCSSVPTASYILSELQPRLCSHRSASGWPWLPSPQDFAWQLLPVWARGEQGVRHRPFLPVDVLFGSRGPEHILLCFPHCFPWKHLRSALLRTEPWAWGRGEELGLRCFGRRTAGGSVEGREPPPHFLGFSPISFPTVGYDLHRVRHPHDLWPPKICICKLRICKLKEPAYELHQVF